MKRTNYFAYLLLLLIGFAFISCEDDEEYMETEEEGESLKQPVLPPSNLTMTLPWDSISDPDEVSSLRTHLDGQKNRSSENFSFEKMKDFLNHKYACIVWETNDPNMLFKVKIDVTGTDLDYNDGNYLTDGSVTLVDDNVRKHIDKFYIANPINLVDPSAKSGEFKVTYRVFEPIYGHIFMACSNGEGKANRRVSDNMEFTASYYRVHTADSINIMKDVTAGSDEFYYKDVKSGDTIKAMPDAYIAGTSSPSMVWLEPCDVDTTHSWMSRIPDETPLWQISIPGTHDAATGHHLVLPGMAKCQNFDFPRQLMDGIRCFDIRLNYFLMTHHSLVLCNTTCKELFDYVKDFLERYKRETVIFLVSAESPDKFMKFFDEYPEYKSITHLGTKITTLGEVRGKIVIMRRFEVENNKTFGINLYNNWPNDSVHEFENDGNKFYVQDRFFSASETIHDTQEKDSLVLDGLNKASSNSDNYKERFFFIYNNLLVELD